MAIVYGIFPTSPISVEHDHSAADGKITGILDWLFECHDHPCDDCHSRDHHNHGDDNDHHGDEHDCSHSHTLLVTQSPADSPVSALSVSPDFAPSVILVSPILSEPEGPRFGLLKPPQFA